MKVQYLHTDHLGSPVAATDADGDEVGTQSFYPFGGARPGATGIFDTERGFTGQIADAATGLNFYNARYMDPVLGRFISPDSIVPNPFNANAYNRFTYVTNNPLVYTDPTGHCSWCRRVGNWVENRVHDGVEATARAASQGLSNGRSRFVGIDGTLLLGPVGVTAEIGVVVDSNGNYGVQRSFGGGGGLGLGGSVGIEVEETTADNILEHDGTGLELGGEVSGAFVGVAAEFVSGHQSYTGSGGTLSIPPGTPPTNIGAGGGVYVFVEETWVSAWGNLNGTSSTVVPDWNQVGSHIREEGGGTSNFAPVISGYSYEGVVTHPGAASAGSTDEHADLY